jgi:hypothetical protein
MTDRFWIGGTGNFNDTAHWSLTSGGEGGASAPTATENAIFDANSGIGIVTVDQTSSCFNLDFTNSTLLEIAGSSANSMNVYGDLILKAGMTESYAGTFQLKAAETGHIINMAGLSLNCEIYTDSVNGGWTLASDLVFIGKMGVQHNKGVFDTAGFDITGDHFLCSSFSARTLNLNDSVITVSGDPNGDYGGIAFSTQRANGPLTLNAGTSKIILTGDGGKLRPGAHTLYDVEFQNNGQVSPDDMVTGWGCHDLVLPVAKTVKLPAAMITTISGAFAPIGTAGNLVAIRSTTDATQFTISKASGDVNGNYLDLMDCIGAGGVNFSAGDGSINSGNNSGWEFNRYWVGNGGNWNDDTNHWALTSGGNPGAGNLPSSTDNAIFDANSGTGAVAMDAGGYCRDLNFTNSTILEIAGANNISIYGDLLLKAGMTSSLTGMYIMKAAETGHIINTAGVSLNGDIYTDNVAGGWTLASDLTFIGEFGVQHLKGSFNTAGFDVTASYFLCSSFSARSLTLGDSVITVSQASGGSMGGIAFSTQRANGPLTLDAGTSKVILTGDGAKLRPGQHTLYDVEFQNNGEVDGDDMSTGWTCHEFTPAKGKLIKFPHGFSTTIQVNPGPKFTGEDGNIITIESTDAGTAATLVFVGGKVHCDWLSLKDSIAGVGADWYEGANTVEVSGVSIWLLGTGYFTNNSINLMVDTDGALTADSDTRLATQKAVKAYVDTP